VKLLKFPTKDLNLNRLDACIKALYEHDEELLLALLEELVLYLEEGSYEDYYCAQAQTKIVEAIAWYSRFCENEGIKVVEREKQESQ
jgi:hypothetical protein